MMVANLGCYRVSRLLMFLIVLVLSSFPSFAEEKDAGENAEKASAEGTGKAALMPFTKEVHLKDGTVVSGTILMKGTLGLVILVGEEEKFIKTDEVEKISDPEKKKAPEEETSSLVNDKALPVEPLKVVRSKGQLKAEKDKGSPKAEEEAEVEKVSIPIDAFDEVEAK